MNNGENGEPAYQDSIHPPDLIVLDVSSHERAPDNSSSIPSPDSPLSTPPDSPLRVDSDDDDDGNEEEKKEEDRDQDDGKALLSRGEVPVDEYKDNENSTKKGGQIHEHPVDESSITFRGAAVKEHRNGNEEVEENNSSSLLANSASKPFDEDVKKTNKEFQDVDDHESIPDDEKKVDDSSLPVVPQVVRSSDNVIHEVMKPDSATQATNTHMETKVDHLQDIEEQPRLGLNSKDALSRNDKSDHIFDEPPSLSLVEEAKKRLSAHGLSDSTETDSAVYIGDIVEDDDNNIGSDISNADVQEPPSLSRVEEAMKRTSMMVLKHNIRDRRNETKDTPSGTTEFLSTASERASANTTAATKNNESNRLAALQRDLISLKSSLSDMNKQLHTGHMNLQNQTNALNMSIGEKVNLTEDETRRSESNSVKDYNDIPSTTIPVTTASTELSPLKTTSNIGEGETSFDQCAVVVTPDGEFDCGNFSNSDAVEEDDQASAAHDKAPLYRNASHVVPNANNEDEIMTAKNSGPSISKVLNSSLAKDEENDLLNPTITRQTMVSSLSQDKSNDENCASVTSFRKMTPKKDLKGSDKGSRWLQEELRRRAVVKREINSAIEARGKFGCDNNDSNDHTGAVVDELPSISSPPDLQNSQSTMDEEVAAITANDERNLSMSNRSIDAHSSGDGEEPPSLSKTNNDGKISRKLDYGHEEDQPHDEFMDQKNNFGGGLRYQGFRPVFDYQDIQHEMKKFASETRAALREQSFTDIVKDPSSSAVPVAFSSPLSTNRSIDLRNSDAHPELQSNAIPNTRGFNNNIKTTESISINFSDLQAGEVPKMLISMDSFDGIASGDIFLSLLSENTGRSETSVAATWADRVHGAIWRARRMRKRMTQVPNETRLAQPLVRGGSQTVASVQHAALIHLKHDEIDDSINLLEGIVFAYYSYFERSLNLRENNPTSDAGHGSIDFKPYLGMALHNLGVLNLLKGDYDEALSYFIRAVENRKSNLGDNHPHYISSLVRLAVCRYALNEFAEAHAGLEEALACAKRRRSTTLEGRLQVAEILNNLGCLAYMSGQPTTASSYYRDSMDIQFGALSDSLYLGNATSGQSISLNISIARANIGFIKLVTKDLSVAITALENALMEQQILLKGLDDTLVATMDHLALSNLLVGSQEKAALMYNRILTLQQNEYGPNDRRCFVTVEKMNMVQGKGVQYEGAIEELRKTFSMPPASKALNPPQGVEKEQRSPRIEKNSHTQKNNSKNKKKKVLKALTSMMKKNP